MTLLEIMILLYLTSVNLVVYISILNKLLLVILSGFFLSEGAYCSF